MTASRGAHRVLRILILTGVAVALTRPAVAQSTDAAPVFALGPIEWTPAVALRDVGTDSNIFDTPSDHRADFTWTLSPRVNATLDAPRLKVSGMSAFDAVYFDRYSSERSLNRRFTTRVEVPLPVVTPFLAGGYEHVRDRENGELDVRATRQSTTLNAGGSLSLASRVHVRAGAGLDDARYADGQTVRGLVLADNLDRRIESGTLGLRVDVTPLTTLVVDGGYMRHLYRVATDKDQRDRRLAAGFQFSPDAVIRGRATIGYHSLLIGPGQSPVTGVTADVDLSYVLLGVTRFDGRYLRDTTHSVEAPYFLQTIGGLSVLQTFFGPFDLTGRGTRETMTYPGRTRADHTDTVAGGLSLRVGRRTRLAFDYELVRRHSELDALRYERRRVLSSLLVGF